MPRRKVTMLEAFQASARRSVERAAEEQKKLAEEREREARRAASAKTTQAWTRRITEGVGSLFGPPAPGETIDPGSAVESAMEGGEDSGSAAGAPAVASKSVAAQSGAATPGASTDSMLKTDLTVGPKASPLVTTGSPWSRFDAEADFDQAGADQSSADQSSADSSGGPDSVVPDLAATTSIGASAASSQNQDEEGRHGDDHTERGLGGATSAQVTSNDVTSNDGSGGEAALAPDRTLERSRDLELDIDSDATLESVLGQPPGLFTIPMSGRAFAIVAGLLLVTVFALGMSLGGASHAAEDDAAGGSGGAQAGPANADASIGFARVPDRNPVARGGAGAATNGQSPMGRADGGARAVGADTPNEATGPAGSTSGGAGGYTSADLAFLDSRNRFTILAVTYTMTETNEALALATYNTLSEAGFPVVKPVAIEDQRRIFILVGATEVEAELETLLREVRAFPTSRGRKEFSSALVVNTKDYQPE